MSRFRFSAFGQKLAGNSGIFQLMEDLDEALNRDPDMLFLGGGNPAHIDEVARAFQQEAERLVANEQRWRRVMGVYDGSQGASDFLAIVAQMLREQYGWDVSEKNIALTNGSQNSFFLLFNLLAGRFADGKQRQILLPMLPEYIGYADVGIEGGLFSGLLPRIEERGAHEYKYRIDFETLEREIDPAKHSLLCFSRPTNPTGNVLTDDEVERLVALTGEHRLPLLVDNAYGDPFPKVLFEEAKPYWADHVIQVMSLSKIGLPGVRTGIILAHPEIIEAVKRMNAIVNLAGGSMGPALAGELIRRGELQRLSEQVIKPFYQQKSQAAVNTFHELMPDSLPYAIHRSEGAFFLWLRFRDLPISDIELYQRLKKRRVLVVPGSYYFPGITDRNWRHQHECLRVSFAQSDDDVKRGLAIIAEEAQSAYNG